MVCLWHASGVQDFTNPFDIFETFFGGMGGGQRGAQRNRPTQGDDERYDLNIAFLEAVFGVEKNIEVTRLETCATCTGSGNKPGSTSSTCTQCKGQGQVGGYPANVQLRSVMLCTLTDQVSTSQCKSKGQTGGQPHVCSTMKGDVTPLQMGSLALGRRARARQAPLRKTSSATVLFQL